jgi:hypothetical protein
MSHFLLLARELRDLIYSYYVAIDGGYVYDPLPEPGRLRAADGRRNGLALMYTCRQVAAEMKGLALRDNVVTFSTSNAAEVSVSVRACRFHVLMQDFHERAMNVLFFRRAEITPEILDAMDREYPSTRVSYALRYILDSRDPDPDTRQVALTASTEGHIANYSSVQHFAD